MGIIYALYSTDDDNPRYVGQTTGTLGSRLSEHRISAESGSGRSVYRWMRAKWLAGFEIDIVELNCTDNANLDASETRWITWLPGLVNDRKRLSQPEIKRRPNGCIVDRIRRLNRRYIDNYQGYHGIRYWKDADAHTVTVCYGSIDRCWRRYVRGDELPWVNSWQYWFSDLARAIDARELARAEYSDHPLVSMPWPSDQEDLRAV